MTRLVTISVLLLVSSVAVQGTTVLPADLGELARQAQAIPRGRVIAVEARWTEDRRAIETIVTLEAETYLKGAFGPTVQFRIPGGRLGRFQSVTVGAPEFAVGQRVIVFLGARGPRVPHVLGFSQGVFRIQQGRNGLLVSPPLVLPSTLSPTRPARVVRGDNRRRSTPLADFEQRVRTLSQEAR